MEAGNGPGNEDFHDSERCFRMRGGGWLKMELTAPLEALSLSEFLQIPTLPMLRKLTVDFPDKKVCETSTSLLQNILDKATAITDFGVSFCEKLPINFQSIILPSSLTSITLACVLRTHHLDIIKDNQLRLPNLSHLELLVPQQLPLEADSLFDALESVGSTLRSLSFTGMAFAGSRGAVTYLQLPIMENLEKLEILSMNCELAEEDSQLDLVLPNLRELTITNQTLQMLKKWTGSSASSSVTKVDVHVITVTQSDLTTLTLDRHEMSALHTSFPNITFLSISVYPMVTSGLHYIFQEMVQLRELTVEVVPGSGLGADFWDSLLIGVQPCTVKMLKSDPNSWEDFQLTSETAPSIRNLRNLRSLSLWEMDSGNSTAKPLISDVSFYFAFFMMTSLRTLIFGGPFKPRKRTMETWREMGDGRTISYE